MSKGHRTKLKRERNEQYVDKRPSAKLSNARCSARKAAFVLDAIRGKDVKTAVGIVTYSPRYASRLIKKLIESAIANATNNNHLEEENLYVAECFANNATTYKRMQPRAQGRGYSILKRNSHITVILDDKNNITSKKVSTTKEVVNKGGQDGSES